MRLSAPRTETCMLANSNARAGRATTTDQAPKEGQCKHAASPPSAVADLADETSDASIRPAADTGSAVRVAARPDTVGHPGRAAVCLVGRAAVRLVGMVVG